MYIHVAFKIPSVPNVTGETYTHGEVFCRADPKADICGFMMLQNAGVEKFQFDTFSPESDEAWDCPPWDKQ